MKVAQFEENMTGVGALILMPQYTECAFGKQSFLEEVMFSMVKVIHVYYK